MGIAGLLPLLEKGGHVSRKCHISEFSSCVVAIDSYCWLHKGAFSCADKIVRGEHTDAYIKYCIKYVDMLMSHSIKPILVFDGRHLPAKAHTEAKRRESRNTAKKRAAELLRLGQVEEARSYMRRCVDITHEMALRLIQECHRINVDCIVAPYEADAQLAYLNKINIADIVITEDSDLVLFGCSKIIFKMDLNGNGVLVENCKLPLVMKCPLEHYSFNKFRQMCIMSGCDYLPSLPGIGLAKARQFMNATRDPDIRNALKKLPSYFNKNQLVVTDEYRDSFVRAEATFKHQLVYDPIQRTLLPLNSLESEGTDIELCSNAGEQLDADTAFNLALGNLDPFTLKRMDDWNPHNVKSTCNRTNGWSQTNRISPRSIWNKDYLEHAKRMSLSKNTKCKTETAISFASTRTLSAKVLISSSKEETKDNNLTVEDLSSMYCVKEPMRNVIVPETQHFEDIDASVLSNNPFSKGASCLETGVSLSEINSARKRRRLSNGKENSVSPQKESSPILESKNKNFRKFLQSNAYSKLSKLSKFQRTALEGKNLVQSKFFSCDDSPPTTDATESGLNVSGIAKLHVDESDPIRAVIEEGCSSDKIVHINGSSQYKHMVADDPSRSTEKTETINFSLFENKKHNPFGVKSGKNEPSDSQSSIIEQTIDSQLSLYDSTYPLEDLVTPVPSQYSESSQNANGTMVEDSMKTTPLFSQRDSLSSFKNVIRNQSTCPKSSCCRRPGLQRKGSAPSLSAGQKTLANFGFFQKSQLKH